MNSRHDRDDDRYFDIAFEKAGRGRWRVIRGFGNHIGYVERVGNTGLWRTLNREELSFGYQWQRRWVAAFELSQSVPLAEDTDAEDFRVPATA